MVLSTTFIPNTKVSRVILFSIGRYWFALPIAVALRVIDFPPEFRTTLNQVGLVDLGDRAIALLDLHQQFDEGETVPRRDRGRFLIVVQASERELYGIPVDEPPILRDIAVSKIRQLPPTQTATALLDLVSHVAILDSEIPALEVFLLDLNKISLQHSNS